MICARFDILKSYRFAVACAIFIAAPAVAATSDVSADLVFVGGRVHTEDARRRVVQGLAIRGNTIIAVGADQEVRTRIGPKTRMIDLRGRVVLPGIIDAHTHPAESAQDAGKCSLKDRMISPLELKAAVASCLKSDPGERNLWFEVIQVDPSGLTLTRGDLDSILPGRPMLLSGADGHTVWANTAALRAAHISADTKDPLGGRIERDGAGEPTGTLRDAAGDIAVRAKPMPSLDSQVAQLEHVFAEMRAMGITSVQDTAVDGHAMQLYKRL